VISEDPVRVWSGRWNQDSEPERDGS